MRDHLCRVRRHGNIRNHIGRAVRLCGGRDPCYRHFLWHRRRGRRTRWNRKFHSDISSRNLSACSRLPIVNRSYNLFRLFTLTDFQPALSRWNRGFAGLRSTLLAQTLKPILSIDHIAPGGGHASRIDRHCTPKQFAKLLFSILNGKNLGHRLPGFYIYDLYLIVSFTTRHYYNSSFKFIPYIKSKEKKNFPFISTLS